MYFKKKYLEIIRVRRINRYDLARKIKGEKYGVKEIWNYYGNLLKILNGQLSAWKMNMLQITPVLNEMLDLDLTDSDYFE